MYIEYILLHVWTDGAHLLEISSDGRNVFRAIEYERNIGK